MSSGVGLFSSGHGPIVFCGWVFQFDRMAVLSLLLFFLKIYITIASRTFTFMHSYTTTMEKSSLDLISRLFRYMPIMRYRNHQYKWHLIPPGPHIYPLSSFITYSVVLEDMLMIMCMEYSLVLLITNVRRPTERATEINWPWIIWCITLPRHVNRCTTPYLTFAWPVLRSMQLFSSILTKTTVNRVLGEDRTISPFGIYEVDVLTARLYTVLITVSS